MTKRNDAQDPLLLKAIEVFAKVDKMDAPVTAIRNALAEAEIAGARRETERIINDLHEAHNAWLKAGHEHIAGMTMAFEEIVRNGRR